MLCTDCRAPVRPVVAVDIDGTLGDYHGHFLRFASDWLNKGNGDSYALSYHGKTDLASHLGITKETYRTVKLAYRQGGMKRLMPTFEGARELLCTLEMSGAEIWITTTRPYLKLDSTDPDTRHWLERHRLPYDHLLYDDDKYSVLCDIVGKERIVGVLDDLDDNYDRAEALGIHPILRKTSYNSSIQRGTEATTLAAAGHLLSHRVREWSKEHGYG